MKRTALAVAVFLAACVSVEEGVTVSRVFVVPGAGLAPGAVYAAIDNGGRVADTLIGVELEDGSAVMLHDASMHLMQRVAVPARGTLWLKPGGLHGMAAHVSGARGDTARVTFHFTASGQIAAHAMVIDYAQVDSAVGRGGF